MEQIRNIDGITFKRILCGGARGIRRNINEINELNVFPVPDGDTGTNMSRTIDSGISKIPQGDPLSLSNVASDFSKGSLFGARGNSGVILSQFFAGLCSELEGHNSVTVSEFASAYMAGVKRSYAAVSNPVEGTILTVFRESSAFALDHIKDNSTLDEFLKLTIEEAERSLERTRDILPVLTEADVVDSGGAGYLCIAKGMYEALLSDDEISDEAQTADKEAEKVNYDLFTTDSVLEYGYCTECLVRIQRAKCDASSVDEKKFSHDLEALGCDSVVVFKEGDILKVHAHTKTPSDVLTKCQTYGEFLNIKIENMSLQHSERNAENEKKTETTVKKKKPHKTYGVVSVATGDGMQALFESLGADIIINGGQTGNPSAEQFLDAFSELDAGHIIVFPNNSNILLTANQASELWGKGNVYVVPTKTLPQGYSALSVFNAAITDPKEQLSDLISAKDCVVSGELTVAIRDSVIGGVEVKEGDYIGILDGELVSSLPSPIEAMCEMIEKIDDLCDRELLTLFVGDKVSDDDRVEMTEYLEERFPELAVEVFIGGQEIYDYLIAVE